MKALLVNLYAASGGPSVATHRLCRVLVEEHVDAHLLVPFGDVEVMTNRLLELIHHLVLCDNWGRKDRKRTIREFSVGFWGCG